MRKAMKHNEPNGNAGELMLELRSPRLIEGYKTWCGLLCAYRTTITEELKERLSIFNAI